MATGVDSTDGLSYRENRERPRGDQARLRKAVSKAAQDPEPPKPSPARRKLLATPIGQVGRLTRLAVPTSDVWLGMRMATWRAALVLLKQVIPLPRLVRLMSGSVPVRRPRPGRDTRIARVASIVYRLG